MPQRILVTGAAGFIGSHLCKHLLRDSSVEISGIDNLRSGDWSRTPEIVKRVERDINEFSEADWRHILEGVEVVYHLAAEKYNSSKSTPERLLATNVLATERLARAAAKAEVKRFVFTSSLYAYGSLGPETMTESNLPEPITLYGASKVMGEHILRSVDRELGLSWNVARLFFIYGPRQHAEGGYKSVIITNFERLLRGEPAVVFGDGQQSLDYVYVDDCVEALSLLGSSDQSRKLVNIASGKANSVNDLTEEMTSIAEQSGKWTIGPADWTAGSRRVGDPSLFERLFDWRASTPIQEGLRNVHRWMSEESR